MSSLIFTIWLFGALATAYIMLREGPDYPTDWKHFVLIGFLSATWPVFLAIAGYNFYNRRK